MPCKNRLIVFLGILLFLDCTCTTQSTVSYTYSPSASSATWNVNNGPGCVGGSPSGAQADVQTCINAASTGDMVVIPSGSFTWTTLAPNSPSVTINKAIVVQGQTTCSGRAATLSCTDGTIINDGTGTLSGEELFYISASNARLTGVTIVDSRGIVDSGGYIVTATDITGWRIDHVVIKSNIGGTGTGRAVEAHGYGLIDHAYVQNVGTAFPAFGDSVNDGTYRGDYSWTQPLNLGSRNAVYVEDSELNYSAATLNGQDDYQGGRLVFRYNDVQGTNIGGHGLDSGGLRSTFSMEIYNNTFTNSGSHISQWFSSRGGTHMVFNNTISASGGSYDTFLDLRSYRSGCTDGSQYCTTILNDFGACDGTTAKDQNTTNGQGWACRDQVGRSTEADPANDWPTNTSSPTFSEISRPGYSWGNNWKGSAPTISNVNVCGYNDCVRAQTYHIRNNRDFYMEAASFNGSSGTGAGTLASRPTTCTTGAAYWAIDAPNPNDPNHPGVLYTCASTNSWSAYYSPYVYPHRLQSGGNASLPTAPTNLVAMVN